MSADATFAADFAAAADELGAGVMRRPDVRAATERDGFSAEAWAAVSEAGWAQVLVPEDAGGLGGRPRRARPAVRRRGAPPDPGPLLEHAAVLP